MSFPNEALVAEAKLPLLLGGFVLGGEKKTELEAKKPAWKVGAKASLNRSKFTLSTEDELVDEDELLAADGMGAPELPDDLGCSARKPCANCTCGRAEQLDDVQITDTQDGPPASGCGMCHKGDAFRCASCPHLGKPAFQQGQPNLVLQVEDDF